MGNKRINWCEAPVDIIFEVVMRKELSLADVWRMGSVCKSWRSIFLENDWFGLHVYVQIGKTSFPWLMLAESDSNSEMRAFYNPATRQVSQLYLPEAKGRRCCGSGHGWIVTMGLDMEIKLLNPLTRKQLSLPSQLTFTDFEYPYPDTNNHDLHIQYSEKEIFSMFIRKAILTCNPLSSECLVVAILTPELGNQVAFVKPGDLAWTLLPCFHPIEEDLAYVEDLFFHTGKLFCITYYGDLIAMDLYGDHEYKWKVISSQIPPDVLIRRIGIKFCVDTNYYLLQIFGEFIVVFRAKQRNNDGSSQTLKIMVFKWSEKRNEWSQINEIGDCCFFLGTNGSICISPTPRGFCSNCIYFTDDFLYMIDANDLAGSDMVAYSMDNDKLTSFYTGEVLLSDFSPSFWVTLGKCFFLISLHHFGLH